MKERYKVISASYLLLRQDKELLMLRRSNTGYMDGRYSLPAGHLEKGEPADLALIREAEEEIGVSIKRPDLNLRHVLQYPDINEEDERLILFFETRRWKGEPTNLEPQKCDDLRWFDLDKLPKNITPEVQQALEQIAAGKYFSSYGLG